MSQELKWEGNARGQIIEYGLSEVESGAKTINIVVKVNDYWDADTKEWINCTAEDYRVVGSLWIVKKDGTLDQKKIQSIIQHAGWDGDMEALAAGTWEPKPISFTHEKQIYKDETQWRIGFINAYDRTPGATGNVTPEKAKALQAQYGAQLRALAGNVTRQASTPKALPSAPKAPVAPEANPASVSIPPIDFKAEAAEAAKAAGNDPPPF